jgi:hypothetical protein
VTPIGNQLPETLDRVANFIDYIGNHSCDVGVLKDLSTIFRHSGIRTTDQLQEFLYNISRVSMSIQNSECKDKQ